MPKKAKGKQRLDKYYHLAKEAGYRSRAVYKLIELDAKHDFLRSARAVLDLCAAPGGWMQVAVKHAPVGALVLGIDLDPIRPVRGAHSLVEDITTPKCRAAVKRVMSENGCSAFDVVLHDGSPNIGGKWNPEATTQAVLVLEAIRLATQFLAPKGTFVSKVFRSQDYSALIYCLKQLFDKVEVTKPRASRSASAETFVVGIRYKAPAKIDPRLLDMKHLFQGDIDRPKVLDVLKPTKQKRHREGYEDGNTTLWKVGLVSEFVWSETPLEFLGSVNALSFEDPACLSIKDNELTTEEIRSLCEDLYVLDKHGFKHLLKWRMRIRKALSPSKKVVPKAGDAEHGTKDDEDDRLLNEMEELSSALSRKEKKKKKLIAKRAAKDKLRKATGMQIDATEDSYYDRELFSLSSIKGKKELVTINSADLDDNGSDFGGDSESEETHAAVNEGFPSDMDSDEEKQRYDNQLDEILDEVYDRYLTRKGGNTRNIKRAKRNLGNDSELLEDGVGQDMTYSDSDQEPSDKEKNPLMVSLNEDDQPTQEQIMKKWFDQDVFAEAAEAMVAKSDSEDEAEEKLKIPKKPDIIQSRQEEDQRKQVLQQEDGFEVVPAEPIRGSDDSSSSSDESEEPDEDTKAEILAYAKKMLRKKQREHILDDAYNKYMFDDEGLPYWFANEEKKHCQPIKPVTREEIAEMRAQFKEINARPAKKVAEAKARKKRAVMKKLEKVRHKANSISDQPDIAERSKSKMIDQLYKKAMPKRPRKELVVAKRGVQVRTGKGKKLVDPRMKKDSRSRGIGRHGKGKSKNGKGGAKGKGNSKHGKGGARGRRKGSFGPGEVSVGGKKGPSVV